MASSPYMLAILATLTVIAFYHDSEQGFTFPESLIVSAITAGSALIDTFILALAVWSFSGYNSAWFNTVAYILILFSLFICIRAAQVLSAKAVTDSGPGVYKYFP